MARHGFSHAGPRKTVIRERAEAVTWPACNIRPSSPCCGNAPVCSPTI
ncbi:hypothetical protein MOTT27_01241 [Mycobacterium intracellulare subsp. yongonense]|nr:hypothetical protein MOTT27_01241 [Mycobacterium intracellulare subsp. yongonense]